jgi:hypothetical protein
MQRQFREGAAEGRDHVCSIPGGGASERGVGDTRSDGSMVEAESGSPRGRFCSEEDGAERWMSPGKGSELRAGRVRAVPGVDAGETGTLPGKMKTRTTASPGRNWVRRNVQQSF